MRSRFLVCLFVFSTAFINVKSQDFRALHQLEDSLASISRKIQRSGNDSVKLSMNALFRSTLKSAILLPGSFIYSFDSLKKLGKLTSPDHRFRIYNWNLPVASGSSFYYCFLQVQEKNHKGNFRIIELNDKSDSIPDPEYASLSGRNWYGALYYRVIPEKAGPVMMYTLLGWEAVNLLQMQKVIEIMILDEKGNPQFGKKMFSKYQNGENKRVIFKYSSAATMALRFEDSFVTKDRKWNASRRRFEEKSTRVRMIVFDRLIQLQPQGVRESLIIPAGDIYDGFIFENGHWNFIQGIDARNN